MPQFLGVFPISGEDLTALPVKDIGPAVAFYEGVLGFRAVSRDDDTAVVRRDAAAIGLVRKPDHDPGEAGSCGFPVADLDALRAELVARGGAEVGEVRTDEWGGKRYRVFFVREGENGYCYCFTHPAE